MVPKIATAARSRELPEKEMQALTRAIRAAAILSVAILASLSTCLAEDWPTKPVKIVVAFGAGGTADVLGRLLAAELSKAFGQQFYVENHAGNAGAIGSAQVVRAEPDGYTLLIGGAGPHLTGPAINPNVGYVTMRDFTHIAMIAGDSFMLAASNSLGVKTFADLVKIARDKPVSCGSPGAGSQGHLIQLLINRAVGIHLQPVPYRGAAENMTDLVGNHVSLALQPAISVAEQVKAGNAVGLAVTAVERKPALGDVPTFIELGYPAVRGVAWFWLTGPKGIPADIVTKLNLAVRKIVQSPTIKEQFDRNALSTMDADVDGLNKFLAEEVALWGSLAKDVGLKVQ
jgi:tripartite-type tricarboxylate transporter receptor subunit TctC